jgi:hypothetical protein
VILPFVTMVIIISEGAKQIIGKSIEDSTVQIMDQNAALVNTLRLKFKTWPGYWESGRAEA